MRAFSFTDALIQTVDTALRAIINPIDHRAARSNPGATIKDAPLNTLQKQHIAGLMRVNHAGEISAQALYQGQALTANTPMIKSHLLAAAAEEQDHLDWCEQRLQELNAYPSVLDPLWYSGSLVIGIIAGLAGDAFSLGFLAETERQVTRHLQGHLADVPYEDHKTQAILKQMILDESQHAQAAIDHGGKALPGLVRTFMQWSSKLLTTSSYYL